MCVCCSRRAKMKNDGQVDTLCALSLSVLGLFADGMLEIPELIRGRQRRRRRLFLRPRGRRPRPPGRRLLHLSGLNAPAQGHPVESAGEQVGFRVLGPATKIFAV